MNKLVTTLMLALAHVAAGAQSLDYPSVWRCDANKPNWYCDDEEPAAKKPPPAAPAQPQASRPLALRDIKTAEQMRAELKRREDMAVMNPSDANLKSYLELWQLTQQKGALFADNWRRVVWQNPELDYSLQHPTNNAAIKIADAQHEANEDQHLRDIAREHGLIFFFRSDCPYCHAMAPMLRQLSEKYGLEILAVSVDGAGLQPEYPQFTDGRATAAAWGVERVPALFIGSKQTGDHAPIGFGQMAYSEIINRIFVLTGTQPGQNF